MHSLFNLGGIPHAPMDFVSSMSNSLSELTEKPLDVFVIWFFLFSFIGYILECVVLTCENRKLITNRGFCHLPICIIYGVCATLASVVLGPLVSSPVLLYFTSMILATTAELVTAHIMIKLFGGFWWDYSNKRFNYKGMISLETSLGWGLVGIVFFYFLSDFMFGIALMIPSYVRIALSILLIGTYTLDFMYCSYKRYTGQDDDTEGVGRKKIN